MRCKMKKAVRIMSDNIISFIFGLFIGGNVSFFATELLMASKKGDNND